MATRQTVKTTFEVDNVLRPIFTGGSAALGSDARILATTLGEDAVLTDLVTGRHLARIEGDGEPISALTITPSASHLIVCSRSLTMRIYALAVSPTYDAVDTTLVRGSKPHAAPVVVLAADRTGSLLATGAADGAVKIWDINGGYVTHTASHAGIYVSALHFFETASGEAQQNGTGKSQPGSMPKKKGRDSADMSSFRLALGRRNGSIRIFDLHKRTTSPVYADAKRKREAHDSDVQALDYSPESRALLSGSRDKTMALWFCDTHKNTWTGTPVPRLEFVEAAGFVGGGRWMYSAGSNGVVRLWDVNTHEELTAEQPSRVEGEAIVSALFVPSKSLILCAQSDHTIALYQVPMADAEGIAALKSGPFRPFRRISGTHDEILDLVFLLPDQSFMALATNSEDVRLVSVATSQAEPGEDGSRHDSYFGQDIGLLKGHEDIVMSLDVDWSGHWLATGAKDNTARVWRIDPTNGSYTCYAVFTGHVESVGAVALPKTMPLESSEAFKDPLNHPPPFLITGSQDKFVQRREIPRTAQQKGPASSLRRLAHDKDINALDINPPGSLFASASQDKTVKIWDVQKLEVQGILRGHKRGVWTVRFAPAGMAQVQGEQGSVAGKGVILTGSGDKTIRIWSLADYTCLRTFEGHSQNVLKVAWLHVPSSGDGDGDGQPKSGKKRVQFASAAGDGLVKVWDANTGELECTLDNHEDRIWALAVRRGDTSSSSSSSSGGAANATTVMASGGSDSTVVFWRDTTAEARAAAADAALRLVEQQQQLENLMHAGAWRDAIVLALQLNHPGRLLALFTNVVTSARPDSGSLTGLAAVDDVLASLSDEQVFLLLLRLRDWNTNARTAPVAQRVLWALVKTVPATRLARMARARGRGDSSGAGKSLEEVLNGLRAYTERHFKRMAELVDESFWVEYTLREMDTLAPALEFGGEEEEEVEEKELGWGNGDVVMADVR